MLTAALIADRNENFWENYTTEYGYTALGQRMQKEVVDYQDDSKTFTRRYMYDGSTILAEYDGNNSLLASYTYSPFSSDDVLSVNITDKGVDSSVGKMSGSLYFLKDSLGSIIDIVDANGVKVQHYSYSVFGKLLQIEDVNGNDISSSPVLDPYFTFTGREYDKESGLYYYRARYYDSAVGRFMQKDPDPGRIANPITVTNKYIYAGNNPINFGDPNGRIVTAILIGAAIGGIAAAISGDNILKGMAIGGILGASGWLGQSLGTAAGILAGAGVQGAVAGAVVGGVSGGLVAGVGYSILGLGSFKDGFIAGGMVGMMAGAKYGYNPAKGFSLSKGRYAGEGLARLVSDGMEGEKKMAWYEKMIKGIQDKIYCKIRPSRCGEELIDDVLVDSETLLEEDQ